MSQGKPPFDRSLSLSFLNPTTENNYRSYLYSLHSSPSSALALGAIWAFVAFHEGLCSTCGALAYLLPAAVTAAHIPGRRGILLVVMLAAAFCHVGEAWALPFAFLCNGDAGMSEALTWPEGAFWLTARWAIATYFSLAASSLFLSVGLFLVCYLWERHRRESWQEVDSASRRKRETKGLLDTLETGVVVYSLHKQVLYANSKGRELTSGETRPALTALWKMCEGSSQASSGPELLELQPAAWVFASTHRTTWNSENAYLATLKPATNNISALQSLCAENRFILSELTVVENDLMRECVSEEDDTVLSSLARVHMLKHSLWSQQVMLRALTNAPEEPPSVLNFRTEVVNAVELTNQTAEEKLLTVTLTFEQGIPRTFEGNRQTTVHLFTFAYALAIAYSKLKEQVTVSVVISGVKDAGVTLSVKFELQAEEKDGEEVVAALTNSSAADSFPASDPNGQSSLNGFHLLLKRVGGTCQASLRPQATSAVLAFWYQQTLQVKLREVPTSALLPSASRKSLSGDKFQWNFRLVEAQVRRPKRGSFRENKKLEKAHSFSALHRATGEDAQQAALHAAVDAFPLHREVNRHHCDISSIQSSFASKK